MFPNSVAVWRKDGHVAIVYIDPLPDEDLWHCLGRQYPLSYELMDDGTLDSARALRAWDARFLAEEDRDLSVWLQEVVAVGAEVDENGEDIQHVCYIEDVEKDAVSRAIDACLDYVADHSDPDKVRMAVFVGEEAVWAYDGSKEVQA